MTPLKCLTLWCDRAGTVERILDDGWFGSPVKGQPFAALMDTHSQRKAQQFLEAIRRDGAATGWDLNLTGRQGVLDLRFFGALTGDQICILGEQQPEIYNQIARLNNELANSQREIAAQNAALERANRELGQFAARVSHDLRAPLRNIQGLIRLFEEKLPGLLDPRAAEWMQHIVANADRMRRLIEGTLAYAQAERGPVHFEPVPLNEVVDQIGISGANIQRGSLPVIRGDRLQIERLFQNLIENAVAYHGLESPQVQIRAEQAGPMWRIAVRDNGIGIAREHHEMIFEMFRSLEANRTGIGLATCRQVVRRHGGEISVDSESGHGTTFYITFPAGG